MYFTIGEYITYDQINYIKYSILNSDSLIKYTIKQHLETFKNSNDYKTFNFQTSEKYFFYIRSYTYI